MVKKGEEMVKYGKEMVNGRKNSLKTLTKSSLNPDRSFVVTPTPPTPTPTPRG
jgi:hypothetical protein